MALKNIFIQMEKKKQYLAMGQSKRLMKIKQKLFITQTDKRWETSLNKNI